MAARFTRWRELGDFHASIVGIVDVQSALAVAADSRAGNLLRSILAELLRGGLNFRYAEGKMILRSELLVIGICGNVQHVFDPIVAIGNLKLVPIDAVILEAAIPVEAKAEQIHVEAIFRGHVFDDESCVNEGLADAIVSPSEIGVQLRAMDKRK